MARIKSQNEIISGLLDFFRIAQPALDTKPGSVARDLAIEGVATQLARLYDELGRVASLQSLRIAIGIDLDRLGSNYAIPRLRASKATGPALLTFPSLDSDLAINKGDIIEARNGATFVALNSTVISSVFANQFKATASKFRADLDFVGITDTYAVEALVESTAAGIQGNISKYGLSKTSISGITNVTNVYAFGGGRSAEDDASYRTRILAVFGGANTGTESGYENAVKADSAVIDAIVITPGDSLMTRDGTQVSIAEDGTRTILSEGTGGKVDVIVFGIRLQEAVDSYVYRDLSNTGDPTHIKNDFVLGQIAADAGKTVTRKRLDNIEAGVYPSQPINNIVSISGSSSGSNFVEQTIDSLGRATGNYKLVRDDGAFGGSLWGFDRIRWTSPMITGFVEDKTKLVFNGQDSLGFTDVLEITGAVQNIPVSNENSRVTASDRTSIQLAHAPITNVTRIFNVTTGERYVIANQNPDGSGNINTTGRITISGRSLPAVSDILQADYTWVFGYDPYFDFDNRQTNNNPRSVRDSIDWGLSNVVRRERATLTASGAFLTATTTHPISSVVSVNAFSTSSTDIILSSGRLAVVVGATVTNVVSIVRSSDGAELWNTNSVDGTFSGLTIFLPTDTSGVFDEYVDVVYNAVDVYNADSQGSFSGSTITVVEGDDATAGTIVECNYISNVSVLLPSTLLPSLPAIRNVNAFATSAATSTGSQPATHTFSAPGVVYRNLRQAPSNLALTIAGSISPGIVTVTGTTIKGVFNAVFTVANAGLTQSLTSALKSVLGLSSKVTLPSTVRIARVVKVERVTTTSSFDVLSVDHEYDVKGYHLFDNTYVKEESVADSLLGLSEFTLPSTTDNVAEAPASGNRLRVTFYYTTSSDSENVSFSKSGTLHTNKRFAVVDTIAVSSGFTSGASASATLTVGNLNQPATRSRYKATYNYTAPKTNERITIVSNFDRLITDATIAIERTRPLSADVLAKSSIPVLVDVEMKITVTEEFTNNSGIVLQNVRDAITTALNARELNTKVDGSDLVAQAYTVSGVDSARVTFFNKFDKAGSVLSIRAQKNEFIRANDVTVELE